MAKIQYKAVHFSTTNLHSDDDISSLLKRLQDRSFNPHVQHCSSYSIHEFFANFTKYYITGD
jgi:hypothetical protein